MKSDLTRDTFDPARHYRAVQQQQGRVQLDADWNEQLDITGHRIETETVDTVGTCGAPMHNDGFRIVATAAALTVDEAARPGNKTPPAVPAGDLLITAGRFYARGVLTENDRISLVSTQPDLPTAAQLAQLDVTTAFPPKAPGTYLAYLDVWPRLRTAIEDPQIREVALGGPDTATRIKTAWQVKFLPAAAGDDCASANAAWDALLNPKLGTLAASVAETPSKSGPCIVDPGSGYRRLENQLYRVEVHIGGDSLAKTTFKWSRDNGSIVTRWVSKQPLSDDIEVESTGRDKVLNIAPGHWVELTDDTREELGLAGTFALVTKVAGNILSIDSASAIGPVEIDSFPKNPKVRRWDSAPAKPGKWIAPDGEKTLNSAAKFELEDGVVVQFGTGAFRTGDYWLIPARTALPFVEWPKIGNLPVQLPPHGVEHHYCKLAIVRLAAGAFKVTDCRHLFPPLTELTGLFYVSGDSQEATPNPTLLPATTPAELLATELPLALPLQAGVANGEWPVAGARVRFTIADGGGRVTPVGPGGGVISPKICDALTGADGVASCSWKIDSTTPNPAVTAELLDDTDARVGLPVIFHARLNTAKLVSYDPAGCEGMKNANPPVITVQDALDFLCHEEAGLDCCVTIGKLGDRPGNYETIEEAIDDLLFKRRYTSICLSLLPGDHVIEKDLRVTPADGNRATYFKIAGCSHAARVVVRKGVVFKALDAVIIRDVSIVISADNLHFHECREVEISRCLIKGEGSLALLNFRGIGRLAIAGNDIQAPVNTKATAPEKLFVAVPELAKAFAVVDDHDFEIQATSLAEKIASLTQRERQQIVKKISATIRAGEADLGPIERKNIAALLGTLAAAKASAGTLARRFQAIRAAGRAGATVGTAIALLDFDSKAVLTENQIVGRIGLGGSPVGKLLTTDEWILLAGLIRKGAAPLTPAAGTLQLRGNALTQLSIGDAAIAALRKVLADGKGPVAVWTNIHCTDNIIEEGENYFPAVSLSLASTHFQVEFSTSLGTALNETGSYIGNINDNIQDDGIALSSLASGARAAALNVRIRIIPIQ